MRKMTMSIVAVAALSAGAAWAQAPSAPESYPYGPRMMGWGGGWEMMIFGPLFMVLVLAAIVAVVLLLVRWTGGSSPGTTSQPPGRTALDILKERYARGEIDKADYEERRRILGE